jgi:hypothetical protein
MLVAMDPEWLRVNALPHWYTRYQTGRLGRLYDRDNSYIREEIQAIEGDINHLLNQICKGNCEDLDAQPEIKSLRRMWEKLGLKENSPAGLRAGCSACSGRHLGIQ